MFWDDILLDALTKGVLLSTLGLIWVLLLVRIVGLRSFSKMTNFDFVMTVAMGSLLAGTAQTDKWMNLAQILTAMTSLFAVQFYISRMRQRSDTFDKMLQNTPVLLMHNGTILHAALQAARVTESDLMAKLREANAINLSAVRAVVLETTGDISVLHGLDADDVLFRDVKRID